MTTGDKQLQPSDGEDKKVVSAPAGHRGHAFSHHRYMPPPPEAPGRLTRLGRITRKAALRTAYTLMVLIVAAALLSAIIWLPQWVLHDRGFLKLADRLAAESALRGTFVQAIAGLVVIGGLYYTGRTLRLNREGQLTDRFTKAVEQLGSSSIDVRVGSVHALERVGRDSRRDKEAVVAVLTEFVRQHTNEADSSPTTHAPTSPRDALLALRVLGRRRWANEEVFRLDLTRLCLVGADISGGDYSKADFGYTHFDRAVLAKAHLRDAFFHSASLRGSGLIHADMRGAHLMGADLTEAFLCAADLSGANFDRAVLDRTDFGGRYKRDGSMRTPPASVDGAFFGRASLKGTILKGVDLRDVKALTQEQVDEAILDESTKLPEKLRWTPTEGSDEDPRAVGAAEPRP